MTGISVIVPTKNEQQDLPGCLEVLSWSDDIHVYDSMSTDETLAIAQRFGAKISQRDYGECNLAFGGDEAAHRNWAIKNIHFKYDWIYHSDADERITPELLAAMLEAIENPRGCVAFRVRRRDYMMGRWLKHVTPSPFNIRLFMRKHMQYERAINPICVVNGKIGDIEEHFNHYSFSKGIHHWVEKHNYYSSLEARQIVRNKAENTKWSISKALFEMDLNVRRYHQKELFYRLPFRPLVKFLLLYVGKFGFLDGRAGLSYAILQSIYEYLILLKTRELELQTKRVQLD